VPPDDRNLISDLSKHVDNSGSHAGGFSYFCLLGFDAFQFGTELPDVLQ
jgi:hypothetical protein